MDPAPDAEEHERALAAERANTDHWRAVARRREEALTALRRRPAVRVLLALDRRIAPVRRAVDRVAGGRRYVPRAALAAAAVPQLHRRRARRAQLASAVRALGAPPLEERLTSVVVVGQGAASSTSIGDAGAPTEVLVVEDRRDGRTSAAGARSAAAGARGPLLCFLLSTTTPLGPGWLARLTAAVGDGAVAAVPTVVHPARPLWAATPHDLLVRHAGLDLVARDDGVPVLRARGAGLPVATAGPPGEVAAGSAAALVVERRAYDAVGGLEGMDDLEAAVADLCVRLRRRGPVVHVPSVLAVDGRPVLSRASLAAPVDDAGPGWRAVVERRGPVLRRAAGPAASGLHLALTVASPSAKVAERWGDWHLAEALGAALGRLGHHARLQTADRADSLAGRCCDVHVVLRGLAPVRRTSGQRHVLWVISHPEAVTDAECDEADLVLVASNRFAEALRRRTTTPVEVLLQATDPGRFRPVSPDPAHRHPVTVVAKTREVLRRSVADALACGLRPAIYGGGWDGLVDPSLVVAPHVPNDELPRVYCSAGVVLNDHWDTMRAWGFVSNRVFDVLACGVPLVSDDLPELRELLGDVVPTYRTPAELHRLVTAALEDPAAARARAERGRIRVLAEHTFDQRARRLLDLLRAHALDGAP